MKRCMMFVVAMAGTCGVLPCAADAAEQTPAVGIVTPFDKNDPELGQIKQLKWKDVDFAAQNLKTRCVALLALSDGLDRLGGKADAQLDLLTDYFNAQNLGEAFTAQLPSAPEQQAISFDDGKKLAVAFVQSPLGADKFGGELEGCDKATLGAYQKMYEKTARSRYEQAVDSRHQVAAMGLFLQKQAKFDDFVKWASAERQRRQAVYDKEMAEKRQQAAQAAKDQQTEKEAAYAQFRAKQLAAQEAAAKQMETAMRLQDAASSQDSSSGTSSPAVAEGYWNGNTWWPWTGAYYSNNTFRGAVRDKVQNSYQNWNGSRINAARAGGGRR
jgi:hypothetical protein